MWCAENVTNAELDAVVPFVQEVVKFDASARAALSIANSESVTLYVEHHLEVLDDAAIASVFGLRDRASLSRVDVLSKLQLVGIGLYPANDAVAIFDYCLSFDVTNYLLAVRFTAAGTVDAIDMES